MVLCLFERGILGIFDMAVVLPEFDFPFSSARPRSGEHHTFSSGFESVLRIWDMFI